jgi:hypothetical protein
MYERRLFLPPFYSFRLFTKGIGFTGVRFFPVSHRFKIHASEFECGAVVLFTGLGLFFWDDIDIAI